MGTDCEGRAGTPRRILCRQEVTVTWTRGVAAGVVRVGDPGYILKVEMMAFAEGMIWARCPAQAFGRMGLAGRSTPVNPA